jgi:hypothetical protein
MIYLLDADQNGSDSIQHLVDSGKIKYLPMSTFQVFDKTVKELLPVVGPDDLVIIDTIGSLFETTRGDAKLGTDVSVDLWTLRGKYLDGDKNYLTVYSLAGDTIIRRIKNLRARGARIITTSHESEKQDPTDLMKKRAPALSDALYKSIMANTSDVVRLSEIIDPILNEDGSVKVPSGTRILQLRKTEEAVAKYHVLPEVSDRIKRLLRLPSRSGLYTYYAHVQKRPTWLHIYGPPGVGKTALSASEAETPNPQHTTPNQESD